MIRTVVAFPNLEAQDTISGMLEKNGIAVRFRCRTGAEAIRSIKNMGGGVVICSYKLPDMTADQLAFELQGEALLLVVAKPVQLDMCEADIIFKLPTPIRASELAGLANRLIQLDQKKSRSQLPERSIEDKEIIRQAKELLMTRNTMTEEQAYKFLQRRSMDTSSKMVDTARLILSNPE